MPEWLNHSQYLVAFITGLLGGVHCFGMCGSIVGALSLGNIGSNNTSQKSAFIISLGYNFGRITSYTLAGAIVAFIGSSLIELTGLQAAQKILATIAALFMIALGLYLAGFWSGLAKIEIIGQSFWKVIQPFGKRFIPVTNFRQAVPLGFIWGWLPCGLVYTALIWTLSAGSALEGALIMLFFGLGTLPNLLAMGIIAARLSKWVKLPAVKISAGLLVIVMGLFTLQRAYLF